VCRHSFAAGDREDLLDPLRDEPIGDLL